MSLPVIRDEFGIRRFDDAALSAQLDRVLASLPDDRRAAAVDVGVDKDGIIAVAVVKLEKGWSVMGGIDKRFGGEWTGKAQLRWEGR